MDLTFITLFFAPEVAVYIRTATFLLVLIIFILWGDRTSWITTEMIINVFRGLSLVIVPSFVLKILISDKLDNDTLFLARLLGLSIISSSLFVLVTKGTRDGTVCVAVIISRIFTESIVLMSLLFTYYSNVGKKSPAYTEEFIWLAMACTAMLLVGNVTFLLRGSDYSMYPQHTIRLNHHLRIDSLLLTLSALALFGFPDVIMSFMLPGLKRAGVFQRYLCQGIAAWHIGSAVISLQASGFLHERDKRAVFLSRLNECFIILSLHMVNLMWLRHKTAINDLAIPIIYYLPLLINSLLGYFTDGTTIYYVNEKERREKSK